MAQSDPVSSKPFRVVIVGAGMVGLSLSHALQLANIDHVVLEKHTEIVSVRGAALVIWPGLARVFDQFGILDKIHATTTPITAEHRRWPDGSLNSTNSVMQQLGDLFEIKNILSDRHAVVKHLYDGLPDKSKIHTGKRIEKIEHKESGVRVHLTDGSIEDGDMVIGSDGVHSTVRSLMWDYANESQPGSIPKTDQKALTSEFRGLFGVSSLKDSFNLGPSDSNVIYGHGDTKMLFTQPGKTYWSIVYRDDGCQSRESHRTSEEEAEEVAKRFGDRLFTDKVTLRDLWEAKTRHGVTDFEEGVLEKWHAGRIVLVGDSVHKMTADLGVGANMAVESAIYLCNLLHCELNASPNRHLSQSDLSSIFTKYQNGRFERASKFVTLSGQATRMHTYQTYVKQFFVSYIAPYTISMRIQKFAELFAQSPKLEYAPVRTINESAKGWHLGKQKEKEAKVGWLTYVLLTSTVCTTIAYMTTSRLSL